MNRATFLRRANVTAVAMAFVLMVIGAWVKANGAGLSCPDWPACYGQYLPPFPSSGNGGTWTHMEDGQMVSEPVAYSQAQILYEWLHRAVVALIAIPVAALFLATRAGANATDYFLHPLLSLRRATGVHVVQAELAWAAVLIFLMQAGLGAMTVVTKNPPWATTLHMMTAVLWFAVLLLGAALAYLRPPQPRAGPPLRARAGYTYQEEP